MAALPGVVVVANTRLPSRRAQALQVVQTSAAFARAGREVLVLHAKRRSCARVWGACAGGFVVMVRM